MIDSICLSLTKRIQKEMPDIDNERAEVINYGLHLLIGELPKIFIVLGLAYLLGVFKLTIITVLVLLPYRAVSGGFHLKTHIGCIVGTTAFYCGIAKISCYIIFSNEILKYIIALSVWIFRNGNGSFACTSRYRKCTYTTKKRKKTKEDIIVHISKLRNPSFINYS